MRDGSVIPHIALAQCTARMDWTNIDLVVYAEDSGAARGHVCLPPDGPLLEVVAAGGMDPWKLASDLAVGRAHLESVPHSQ